MFTKWKKNQRTKGSIVNIFLAIILLGGYGGYVINMPGCSSNSSSRDLGGSRSIPENVIEKPDLSQEQSDIFSDANRVGLAAERVKESAYSIDNETRIVRNSVDPDTGSVIAPNLNAIDNETKNLRDNSEELKRVQASLKETRESLSREQVKINKLEEAANVSLGEIQSLKDQIRELNSEAQQLLKQKMAWIGVVSVFGIGAFIILAFFTKNKLAIFVAIGFLITLGISIAVSMHMAAIAWITTIVAGVAVVGVLAYIGYITFIQNKSVEELVQTGEVTKNYLTQEARDHIFGRGAEPGVADQVQSKVTKKIVRQVRSADDSKRGFKLASKDSNTVQFPRYSDNDPYRSYNPYNMHQYQELSSY